MQLKELVKHGTLNLEEVVSALVAYGDLDIEDEPLMEALVQKLHNSAKHVSEKSLTSTLRPFALTKLAEIVLCLYYQCRKVSRRSWKC